MKKKTPVTMGYEDGVMTVEDWYDGKVLWKVRTGGAIKWRDAYEMAVAWIKANASWVDDGPLRCET